MKNFFLYILLLSLCLKVVPQSNPIGGQVNEYYEVLDIQDTFVDLSSVPTLQQGDKVILMQMTGVETIGTFPTSNLTPSLPRNTGRFEMLAVNNVVGARVYFTVTIDPSNYTVGEKIQLVKIYEADYATVENTNPLVAQKWDGTTGGIIALVIFKKLTLNDDIDASNSGFSGGEVEPGYAGGCRSFATDTFYFHNSVNGIAGSKGSGIMERTATTNYNYSKGPGAFVTGGGGGLGWFAGGGGGSHWGSGGGGGAQNQTSPCTTNKPAYGGNALNGLYADDDRVILGGGGGSSTQDGTYSATKGGDGGGIVIIMADTIVGNNRSILNSGESVSGIATAGGGGGGAGGAILLDVNVYSGNLNFDVHGGDGGSTGGNQTGAGGGGGAGVVRYTGSDLPSAPNVTNGDGGDASSFIIEGGSGGSGSTLADLVLPLNGFLFNTINGPDTICQGQVPDTIKASIPRGKSVSYIYEWLQSTDNMSWEPAVGTVDSLWFLPVALTDTTYYTRVVLDTLTDESNTPIDKYVYDTAFSIEVLVYPSLTGNTLDFRDTLCFDQSPGTLTGGSMSGGDGTYEYNWHSRTDGTSWTTDRSTESILNEVNLIESTFYRRIVTSHQVCVDISNTDTITVLPAINNNTFSPIQDTAVCDGSNAGLVRATTPSQLEGGDGNYSFKWLESTDDIDYDTIVGASGVNYSPGILAGDTYYKRIVYSGSDNVCIDTTESSFYLEIYPLISGNSIVGSDTQYVCFNEPKDMTGSLPTGGNGTSYVYVWEEWVVGSGWEEAAGTNTGQDYTSPSLTDTISYRRFVTSGDNAECQDVSDPVLIMINELPTGDIVEGTEAFCEQGTLIVNYSNLAGNGPWTMTVGASNNPLFTTGPLTEPSGSFEFSVDQSASIQALGIVDVNLCEANDTNFVNTLELRIDEQPVADAGSDPEICGLEGALAAQPALGNGLWSGENVQFDEPSNPNSGISTSSYGTYTVTWSDTNGECFDESEIGITFYEQPQETNAGEDQDLDYQFTTTLDAQAATVGEGTWRFETGTGIFEDSTLFNTVVDFSDVGTYELSWTIVNGTCDEVSDLVQINIGDLAIFNGFSPNGDGVNDEFILNMSGLHSSKLIVIDKWGGLVIEIDGTDELKWNGENKNGKPVQAGTYFYIIKEEGLPDRKGYIELRR